jgi:tRNA A37 threonylcarbamoyladenosine synthetase subunit TsaC/SUA5/YrdC
MKIKAYSFRKLIKNKSELVTKIAIVPTDTVIGVVSKTPELIYKIKGRSQDKKLVLFIHDTDQIKALLPIEKDVLSKY